MKPYLESIELSCAMHCNLSCRGCSHASPLEAIQWIDVEKTVRCLKLLHEVIDIGVIRLIGGEPTLYNELEVLVSKIFEIQVAEEINIATNGTKLTVLSDNLLRKINAVIISDYNYPCKKRDEIETWSVEKSLKHDIKITIYRFNTFREPFSTFRNNNNELVQDIYNTCIYAHKWQCANLIGDTLYMCPIAPAIASHINAGINGIEINERPTCGKEVKNYLSKKEPLLACAWCLGSCGKKFDIIQTKRDDWLSHQNKTVEQLIDKEFLKFCKENDIWDIYTVNETLQYIKGHGGLSTPGSSERYYV